MKVNIEKEDYKELVFTLKGAKVSFANLIRRYATSQVPVFAIDKVTIYENTSSLFDEYIAHRIGLIPIKTPAGYKKEEVLFSLEKEGKMGGETIRSKDLKSTDERVKVSNANIPIIELREGQKLRLEGRARLGLGREHAKFQTGIVAYRIEGENFIFTVESFSQMSAAEMISRAADILSEKCEEFESLLGEI